MFQKAFSKIWILVVIAAIVAGGILAWQYLLLPEKEIKVAEEEVKVPEQEEVIEDETANWKTYRNEKYGFELKYPEDAEVKEHDYSEGKIINFIVDFGKISNNKPVIISVKSQDMEGGMREAIDIQSETDITINRIKGTKISGVDQKGLLVSEIWIKHNDLLYIFKGEGDIFNQILSTFRFITPELETMEIKVYFIDREMMIEGRADYKDMVKPVVRTIPKTKTVARAAIEELLKGPLDKEKSTYISSIPKGVKINSLEIKNGIAYIDFSEELSAYGGGSASALTIGWQIRKTLMQFPTVGDVVISIEGRTEDILQP